MEGWIKLHRKLIESPIWNDKPYSKGQAWVDLLLIANHKDSKEYYRGEFKTFQRGCVHRSITWLSDRWGWGRDKTRRYLKSLQADNMITVKATTNDTTITIVKYDDFQSQHATYNATDNTTDNATDDTTDNTHTRMNKNDKKKKNVFIIPTLDEVKVYCVERKNNVDPESFIDFYSAKGWMIGKNKMKDWKSAIRTWERNSKKKGNINYEQRNIQRSEYDEISL